MHPLEHYVRLFSNLRRAPGSIWPDTTKNQAPHKPILLFSVLDMAAIGQLPSNYIDISGDLNELNDLFHTYWNRVVPSGQISSIAFPFSRLHNEGFWKLVPKPGNAKDLSWISNISTVSQLRDRALGAEIDKDLFYYMQDDKNRNMLRQALLQSYFSEQAQREIEAQTRIITEAYSYSLELIQRSHEPIVSAIVETDIYKPLHVRDQGFRRAVVTTYDHRCALCGVRMITPEGHTAVDAAHIVPWSESHNDDIRNGMALCKLCHWTFDEGFIGVSEGYTVLVAHQLASKPNMPGLLYTLQGRSIIPPTDKDLWPSQEYLKRHRHKFDLY
ncbi:MAG: HNH endonuclease [Nitrospiraceae bacterium]|nr:MAG: HNH endonuclease [Nitrospiraceae bacterium]